LSDCKFILTKGKNKGKMCNKNNCTKHNTTILPNLNTKNEYFQKYFSLYNNLSNQYKKKILKNIDNLYLLEKNSSEFYKNKVFLDNFFTLPFDKYFTFSKNEIKKLENEFDEHIYKMNNVKNELVNYLCKKSTNPNSTKNILGLYGSPGIGKTKIIQTLSNILNYPMYTIPLGGIKDSSYLLGHNYTFVESNYGEIVRALVKTNIMNPIVYFDELDKISESNNGKEIYSLLTFITDPSQNKIFKDHYFGSNDITFDLSKVFFIFTFNDITKIDSVLLNRINLINVSDYSTTDIKIILKDYNINNILYNINPDLTSIRFEDDCFDYILNTHPKLTVREYIFLFEKIIMEINKLIFLERKSLDDFLIITIDKFKTIYNTLDIKTNQQDFLSMYL
jgi:ATP-dependent Lon protease